MSCFVCKGKKSVLRWVNIETGEPDPPGSKERNIALRPFPCWACASEDDTQKKERKVSIKKEEDDRKHVSMRPPMPLFDD